MQEILGGVVAIIAIAITIGIGTSILGSSSSAFDCKTLDGYTTPVDANGDGDFVDSGDTQEAYDGWAKACLDAQKQTTQAWTLIPIVLIVIVAAIIITVLRGFYGSTG
ncbi:MAG: hypothetical protein MPK62_00225 [Alphaproteobacteria bacterium]|nr:hypothetical protein [Alphaproteobacteria bacterium]MDA8029563.1 hypothetical protein [Alphaproteobacteria bacterium]